MRTSETPRPLIQKPMKPRDYSINNSLMNSEIYESDRDMQRLDNFNLTFNSEKSVDYHGAKPVTYYKKQDDTRSGVLGSIQGRISSLESDG